VKRSGFVKLVLQITQLSHESGVCHDMQQHFKVEPCFTVGLADLKGLFQPK